MQSIQSWDGPCNVMTRSKTSTYGLSLTLINTWTQINYITSLVPDSSYILCWYPGAGILELCNALHCFGQFEAGHDSNFKQQSTCSNCPCKRSKSLNLPIPICWGLFHFLRDIPKKDVSSRSHALNMIKPLSFQPREKRFAAMPSIIASIPSI